MAKNLIGVINPQPKGLDYFWFALYAFLGLGGEVLLAYGVEPFLYGTDMANWSRGQNILHWILTCLIWGAVMVLLIRGAKRKLGLDLFAKAKPMALWQWLTSAGFVLLALVISYFSWDGWKVVQEFQYNGPLLFVFQYIYYLFETGMFLLIIVFGQLALETWCKRKNFPFGGIVVALTWGAGHFFTKEMLTGLLCMVDGFMFGVVYLLTNRDIKKAFILLFLLFVL